MVHATTGINGAVLSVTVYTITTAAGSVAIGASSLHLTSGVNQSQSDIKLAQRHNNSTFIVIKCLVHTVETTLR